MQLSLENEKVTATADEYVRKLGNLIDGRSDVIGYAFAVNGKINSADVYVSNALFRKLWPRMLKAAAIEAVAERDVRSPSVPAARPSEVQAFMSDADEGRAEERAASGSTRVVTRDRKDAVVYEARDEKSKAVVHRAYVKKP